MNAENVTINEAAEVTEDLLGSMIVDKNTSMKKMGNSQIPASKQDTEGNNV